MGTTLWGRLACSFGGHDHTIRQANGRMFLYCETCGHRSDGIVLTGRDHAVPEARSRAKAERHPSSTVTQSHASSH